MLRNRHAELTVSVILNLIQDPETLDSSLRWNDKEWLWMTKDCQF